MVRIVTVDAHLGEALPAPPSNGYCAPPWPGAQAQQMVPPGPISPTEHVRDAAWRTDQRARQELRANQESQRAVLLQQIDEKRVEKEARARELKAREAREDAEVMNYNPWGRGGGGAPLRDVEGNLQSDLRHNKPPPPVQAKSAAESMYGVGDRSETATAGPTVLPHTPQQQQHYAPPPPQQHYAPPPPQQYAQPPSQQHAPPPPQQHYAPPTAAAALCAATAAAALCAATVAAVRAATAAAACAATAAAALCATTAAAALCAASAAASAASALASALASGACCAG